MNAVVDNIQKAVRVEILDVLEDAKAPVRPTTLANRCESAADIDDVLVALQRLAAERHVVRVDDGYRLPADGEAPPEQKAREAGPQRPARKPTDAVAAVLGTQNACLTIAEIEPHVPGLSAQQIKDACKSKRFQSRSCKRGGSPATKEYGLAHWPAKPQPKADPRTRIDRIVAALESADRWLTAAELADAIDEPADGVRTTLKNGVYNGHVVAGYSEQPRYKRYGLPAWQAQQDEPAQPSIDTETPPDSHRFGLWSDGTFSIQSKAGAVDLPPALTRDLVAYLVRERAQIAHLFDAALDGVEPR